jgi:hypothetical protein
MRKRPLVNVSNRLQLKSHPGKMAREELLISCPNRARIPALLAQRPHVFARLAHEGRAQESGQSVGYHYYRTRDTDGHRVENTVVLGALSSKSDLGLRSKAKSLVAQTKYIDPSLRSG